MSEKIDFGSMEAADAAREDWSEWVCPVDDDERYKTVAFVSETPADVLEAIRVEAQDSRTEARQSSTSVDLTDDERERIKELGGFEGRPTTFSWESAKGVFAREGMGDKFRDALGALTDYDDPAEGAEEWIQNQREADATKGTGGASGGSRDEGHAEERRQRRAGRAARKAREQGCEQAHDYCEGGDEEACQYLREVCGYDEDTVRTILSDDRKDTEQDDLVTVGGDEYPEMDVTPQEAGALRDSWKGYKAATGRLADELDDVREAVVNGRQAIEAINAIRRNHGQDEMHPDALHDLLDALDELPEEIPEVRTLAHFQHRDDGDETPPERTGAIDADRFETMPDEPASLPGRNATPEEGTNLPDGADLYAVVHDDGAQEYIRGFEGDKQAAIEHAEEMGPAYHVEYSLETGDGSTVDADRFEAPETPVRHPRRGDRTKALGRYQRDLARDLIELAQRSRHDDAVPAIAHAMRNLSRSEVNAAVRAANNALPASKQYDADRLGRAAWSEYRYQYGSGTEMERPPDDRHRGRSVSKFELPDQPLGEPRSADPDRLDDALDTGSQFASDRQASLSVGVDAEDSPGEKQVTLTGDDATAANHALPEAWSADAFADGNPVRWGAGPYSVRVADTSTGYNVVLSGPENSEPIATDLHDFDHAKAVAAEFTERLRPPEVSFHSSDSTVPEAAAEAKKAAADENSGLGAFSDDDD